MTQNHKEHRSLARSTHLTLLAAAAFSCARTPPTPAPGSAPVTATMQPPAQPPATSDDTGTAFRAPPNVAFGLREYGHAERAVLARNGHALMTIRVPADLDIASAAKFQLNGTEPTQERYAFAAAVQDLAELLKRMTGADFKVVRTDDFSRGIVVAPLDRVSGIAGSEARHALTLGPDGHDGREAFYVRTNPERVLITANTGYGLSHGVHYLLRALGYRYFFQSRKWEVVPHLAQAAVALHASDRPAFYLRSIVPLGYDGIAYVDTARADHERWLRALMANGESMRVRPSHAWQGLPTVSVHGTTGYEILDRQPDLVLGFGRSHAHTGLPFSPEDIRAHREKDFMFDVSRPIVRALFLALAEKQLAAPWNIGASDKVVSLEPSDGDEWYLQDIADPDWYPKLGYAAPDWKGTISDHVFGLANFVADQLAKRHPKERVTVWLYAYNTHADPPHFPLSRNVRVSVAQGFCGGNDCGLRKLRQWQPLMRGSPLVVEDYYSVWVWNHAEPPAALPTTPDAIHERLWNELYLRGVRGINAEAQADMAMNGLGYYLYSLGMWNPLADFTALRADFLDKAFGAAASEMDAYYSTLSPDLVKSPSISTWSAAIRHLDRAGRIAAQRHLYSVAGRIDEIKYYWYYLYLERMLDKTPADASLRKRFFDLFFRQAPSYSISSYGFRHELEKRLAKWPLQIAPRRWKGSPQLSGCPRNAATGAYYECSSPDWRHYGYTQAEVDHWWGDVLRYFSAPASPTKDYVYDLVPVAESNTSGPRVDPGFSTVSRKFDVWTYSYGGEPVELEFYGFTYPEKPRALQYDVFSTAGTRVGGQDWTEHVGSRSIVLRVAVPSAGAYRFRIAVDMTGYRVKPAPGYPIAYGGPPQPGIDFPGWTVEGATVYVPTSVRVLNGDIVQAGAAPSLKSPDGALSPISVTAGDIAHGATFSQAIGPGQAGFWELVHKPPGVLQRLTYFDVPNVLANPEGYLMVPRSVADSDKLHIMRKPFASDEVRVTLAPAASPAVASDFAGTYAEVLGAPPLPAHVVPRAVSSDNGWYDGEDERAVYRNTTHPGIFIVRTRQSPQSGSTYLSPELGPGWFVMFDSTRPRTRYVSRAASPTDTILSRFPRNDWRRVEPAKPITVWARAGISVTREPARRP